MFRRQVLPVLLTLALALYPVLPAGAVAKSKAPEVLQVKQGPVTGTVKTLSGKPLGKLKLAVLDQKGKTVAKAVTDKHGKFALGQLKSGKYQLALGKGRGLPLHVAPTGTISKVNVVLADDEPAGNFGGNPLGLGDEEFDYLVLGIGTAALVVAIIALADEDDDTTRIFTHTTETSSTVVRTTRTTTTTVSP